MIGTRTRVTSASPLGLLVFVLSLVVTAELSERLAFAHGEHDARHEAGTLGLTGAEPAPHAVRPQPTKLERIEAEGNVFHTLSLAPVANARLDPQDEWQERIWKGQFRLLPRGRQTLAGIPFFILPVAENRGLAAVTLVGGRYKQGPCGGGTLVAGRQAKAIYVLHAASYQNLNTGRVMARYTIHYSDGSKWDVHIRNKIELADFLENLNLNNDCVVAWSSKHPVFPNHYCVYATRLVNPNPDREIEAIEFRPAEGSAVVSVLAITLGEGPPALVPLPNSKSFTRPIRAEKETGQLELTVQADGGPTAARIVVQGSDGRFYEPFDGLNYRMLSRPEPFFYTKGTTSLKLPPGVAKIGIARGFEFKPIQIKVDVPDGDTVRQSVSLKRWIDMPDRGWYSGEMHIHPFDQEPEDTAVCLLGEDLHVGNLLIWGNGFARRYHSDQFFRGKPESWPDARHVASYNEEFRNNTYGHLCLIDLRELVYPMGTGSEYGIEDYPANATIMDRTHAQRAFASVAHMSVPPVNYAVPWEVSVDVALGKADSVDIDLRNLDRGQDRSLDLWYRLLNCGHRIPATCGTDSFMNQSWTNNPLGNLRTFGYLGETFSYAGWVKAAREGRSFVTQGPALFLKIDGRTPGDTIPLAVGKQQLRLQAEVRSLYPLKKMEIVMNGRVVASVVGEANSTVLEIDGTVEVDGDASGWITARAEGESSKFFLHRQLLAHTNPIYLKGAVPQRSPDDARFFMQEIDDLIHWVKTKGIFHNPEHRDEVTNLFQEARAIYEKQSRAKE